MRRLQAWERAVVRKLSDRVPMLQRNMTTTIQLALDDLLADLHFARRSGDLGRLALLAYCEVRGWARMAGKTDIATKAAGMFTQEPCLSREEFLSRIDVLVATLELHQQEYLRLSRGLPLAMPGDGSNKMGHPRVAH